MLRLSILILVISLAGCRERVQPPVESRLPEIKSPAAVSPNLNDSIKPGEFSEYNRLRVRLLGPTPPPAFEQVEFDAITGSRDVAITARLPRLTAEEEVRLPWPDMEEHASQRLRKAEPHIALYLKSAQADLVFFRDALADDLSIVYRIARSEVGGTVWTVQWAYWPVRPSSRSREPG